MNGEQKKDIIDIIIKAKAVVVENIFYLFFSSSSFLFVESINQ